MQIKSFVLGFLAGVVVSAGIVTLILVWAIRETERMEGKSSVPESAFSFCPNDGDANIVAILEPIRKKYKMPAMCAAVVDCNGLVAAGAVGVRKIETDIPVSINDKWHLGSDTKAMTATLIGRLVDQGKLNWNSTLAEIFPELASEMNPAFKKTTLLQVLSHRAGFAENLRWEKFTSGSLGDQRYEAVKETVTEEPGSKPGEYRYSNLGYVIVGAIVERVTESSWEAQIRSLVFEPLHIQTAGFGGTGTKGKIDQPWGHYGDGRAAESNGAEMDNCLIIAPAGCVHCSIGDWAKFVSDQLRGASGKKGLCKDETYKTIRTPPFGGDYALGWIVCQRSWGGGTVFNHCGSNTMNYANAWIAPGREFAVLICTNQGGDSAFAATDEVARELIKKYLGK